MDFSMKLGNEVINIQNVTGFAAGLDAAKTSFENLGTMYVATDTNIIYYYNGSSWIDVVNGGGSTPGIDTVLAVAQALTATRTITKGSQILNITGRSGAQFGATYSILGDYANVGNSTKITIDDVAGTITVGGILDLFNVARGQYNVGGQIFDMKELLSSLTILDVRTDRFDYRIYDNYAAPTKSSYFNCTDAQGEFYFRVANTVTGNDFIYYFRNWANLYQSGGAFVQTADVVQYADLSLANYNVTGPGLVKITNTGAGTLVLPDPSLFTGERINVINPGNIAFPCNALVGNVYTKQCAIVVNLQDNTILESDGTDWYQLS